MIACKHAQQITLSARNKIKFSKEISIFYVESEVVWVYFLKFNCNTNITTLGLRLIETQ